MTKNIIFLIVLFAFLLSPSIVKANVVINEVYYDPDGTDTGLEYVRLYNNGDSPVDLTNWSLDPSSANYFIFPLFTLNAKSFVNIHIGASDINTSTDLYDNGSKNMSNTAGPIALFNHATTHKAETFIDYIEYGTGGQANESEAIKAGIWTEGEFILDVNAGYAIKLKTDGVDNNSSADWEPFLVFEETPKDEQDPETPPDHLSGGTNNQPPIADAGNDIIAFIDQEITFDGSKSYDPDGSELAYEWNLGEGGVQNDLIAKYKYSFSGTYLVTLMVFDGRYYAKDTITVEIYPKKVTINEFLPSSVGKDEEEEWVELYNDSEQIIDISGWKLDDEDGGSKPFTFPENTLIAPKNYLVFSRKTTGIALNNDKDKVRLLLSTGVVFQEVSYDKAKEGQSSARIADKFVWSVPTPGLLNIIISNEGQTFSSLEPLQSETTGQLSEDLATHYKDDLKDPIKGGWQILSKNTQTKENQQYHNLANLEKSAGSNSKLILVILTIIIAVLAVGIGIIKFRKKI